MAHWIVIAIDDSIYSHDIEDNVNDNAHLINSDVEADTASEACEKAREDMVGEYRELIAYRLDDDQKSILSTAERLDIATNLLHEDDFSEYATQCKELEENRRQKSPATSIIAVMAEPDITKDMRITSIEQLKAMAGVRCGQECYILLNGGLRSSKHIYYVADEKLFYITNFIDGSDQTLTETEIMDSAYGNIGEAMAKGCLIAT